MDLASGLLNEATMLLLLFSVDNDDFVIDSAHIQEIIPRLNTKLIPHTPSYIVGTHELRGDPLFIIDLKKLFTNKPSVDSLMTRTIVLKHPLKNIRIGLIAENVRETLSINQQDLKPLPSQTLSYLNQFFHLDNLIVSYIDAPLFIDEILKEIHG